MQTPLQTARQLKAVRHLKAEENSRSAVCIFSAFTYATDMYFFDAYL